MKIPLPTDVYVGSKVRLQRNLREMTQTALAEQLGITFQQVQKYEKGTNRIGSSRLHRLSEILQVLVAFFFPNEGDTAQVSEDKEESDELSSFLLSAENRQLNQYFQRIRDPKVRRSIIALIKAMARETDTQGFL